MGRNSNRTTSYKPYNPNNHSVKYLNRMAHSGGDIWIARDFANRMKRSMMPNDNELHSKFDEETKYEFINREKVYWSEFFIFWDDDLDKPHIGMEYAKPFIIDALYQNSGVGVVMVGDNPLVYRLAMFWRNAFYEVTRATGIIYAYPTDYDASLPNYSLMNRFDLTNGTCALELSSVNAKPWGYGIEAWATRRKDRYVALDINLINSINVKLLSAQNISDNALAEINALHGAKRPWQVIDGRVDAMYDLGLENKSPIIWNDLWNLYKDYHWSRGMRYNFDAKSERNISEEVGKNDASFIVLENEKHRILTDLCKKINKLYKKNISVKKIIDIHDRQREEINAIPQMLAQYVRAQGEIEKQEVANEGKEEISKQQTNKQEQGEKE